MADRDWKYWQERMKAVTDGNAPDFTDEEMAEMMRAEHPDALISDQEKARIRQHGTRKEKERLKLIETLLDQRNSLRDFFRQQKGTPKEKK